MGTSWGLHLNSGRGSIVVLVGVGALCRWENPLSSLRFRSKLTGSAGFRVQGFPTQAYRLLASNSNIHCPGARAANSPRLGRHC